MFGYDQPGNDLPRVPPSRAAAPRGTAVATSLCRTLPASPISDILLEEAS